MQAIRKIFATSSNCHRIMGINPVSIVSNSLFDALRNAPCGRVPLSNSDAVYDANKIYELRTYSLKPEHMKEYLTLTAEKFHLRTVHSILHGYWTVELGGVNQVVHLWEYDSYDHRAGIRAKLAVDEDWISKYFGKILPWFLQQDNMTLKTLPNFETILHPKEKGFYELWIIEFAPQLKKEFLPKLSQTLHKMNENLKGSQICCAFESEFGNANVSVVIWQHDSFDLTKNLRMEWNTLGEGIMQDIQKYTTKALVPFKVSPMQ